MKIIVFIAAGGRGKRLWKTLPELKKSGIPKSLGIEVNGLPLLSFQLQQLKKLNATELVISFNDKDSANQFKDVVLSGVIPNQNYIDIINNSYPYKPWDYDFDLIVITSGDIFFDDTYIDRVNSKVKEGIHNILTLCPFEEYMVTLSRHFQPVYDSNKDLLYINEQDELPTEVIAHPQFLTKRAFHFYEPTPHKTSKSAFINKALARGEKFALLKPEKYVNINFAKDLTKLKDFVG